MKYFCLTLICGLTLCGCGKKNSAAPAQTAMNAPVAAAADQKPLVGTVHSELTAALKSFVQEKRRLPENLLELKSTKLDSMPRPPAGYVFAIDPVTVEVKAVKQ